jgi:hypothetical protein
MRVAAFLAGAIGTAALAVRCASFTPTTDAPDAAGDTAAPPDATDAAADSATSPRLSIDCPAPAGSCSFPEESCCVQHSTPVRFGSGDVRTGKCIEAGSPCEASDAGPVTIVNCDRSELCRQGVDASPDAVCCDFGADEEFTCVDKACQLEICLITAYTLGCADAAATQCASLYSSGSGNYGQCL